MLVYGECECFVMQMLYVCVLCASCGSSQCCVLHDLQFVNAVLGCKRRLYGRGSRRHSLHSLHVVKLSQRSGNPLCKLGDGGGVVVVSAGYECVGGTRARDERGAWDEMG